LLDPGIGLHFPIRLPNLLCAFLQAIRRQPSCPVTLYQLLELAVCSDAGET
jgi:hypothetical protein